LRARHACKSLPQKLRCDLQEAKKSSYNASFPDALGMQLKDGNSSERHQARQKGKCSVRSHAGIAQLVERNLAKVEVASSSLVSRSSCHEGKLPSFPFLSKLEGE
jgi:hypothetical protein